MTAAVDDVLSTARCSDHERERGISRRLMTKTSPHSRLCVENISLCCPSPSVKSNTVKRLSRRTGIAGPWDLQQCAGRQRRISRIVAEMIMGRRRRGMANGAVKITDWFIVQKKQIRPHPDPVSASSAVVKEPRCAGQTSPQQSLLVGFGRNLVGEWERIRRSALVKSGTASSRRIRRKLRKNSRSFRFRVERGSCSKNATYTWSKSPIKSAENRRY